MKEYMTHGEVLALLREGMDIKNWVSKDAPLWHSKAKKMWRKMWIRCYDPTNSRYNSYINSIIFNDFRYFSNFIKWLESQPRFEEFCSTCHEVSWCIDKDMKKVGNKNYYPEYMTLCTKSENQVDRCKRYSKAVRGISLIDNSTILFNFLNESEKLGFNPGHISECCQGKRNTHKGYKWEYVKED